MASFTVASTPRTFDRQSQEWRDGDALFLRCSVWREQAENVAESLSKGSRVVVIGRLKQRSFETKDGEKRTVVELDADEVAPSLRYAQAQVRRTTRGQGGSGTASPSARGGPSDPWATAGAGASGYAESEPPFAHTTGYDLAVHRGEVVV